MSQSETKSSYLEELRSHVRAASLAEGEVMGRLQALRETVLRLDRRLHGSPNRKRRAQLEVIHNPYRLEEICDSLVGPIALPPGSHPTWAPSPREGIRWFWQVFDLNRVQAQSFYLEELQECVRGEALAEGKARGYVQTLRRLILRLGRRRFGRAPSQPQKTRLGAIDRSAHLRRIRDRLLDATSWADLLATP
jgi:hypothetical protein